MANDSDVLNYKSACFSGFVIAIEILILMLLAYTNEFKNGDIWIMVPCVLAVLMLFCAVCVLISSYMMLRQSQQSGNSSQGYCNFNWCKNRTYALWIILLLLSCAQFFTSFLDIFSRLKTDNTISFVLSVVCSIVAFNLIVAILKEYNEGRKPNNGTTDQNYAARSSI
ncbi:MAG: hypothetical protein MHMPM18_004247 [Marteilia pararefringens]